MIMYKRFRGLWVCVMLCLLLPTMALAAGSVAIDSSHFPDNSFREIVDTFDLNGDRVLSETELEKVTSIDCNNKGISSLKGIEYFTKLEELNCSGNQLKDLDVSSNGAMMRLNCSNNNVTTLDVSRNPVLVTLDCSNNKLTALDVSCNANLQYFYCENNQLTSLDVSNHTVLASLDCDSNRLTQLNVKNCTKLSNLSCADNQLTALDVSDNTALVTLDCYNNDLTVLDVSSHSNLATLGCGKNQLTSLYLDNTSVSYLAGADNQYSILVGTDRTYALDRLPGSFDATKASNWVGGTVADGVLKVNEGADQVTYAYNCGRGFTQSFTLNVTVLDDIPIDETHFPDANFRTFVAQYDTDQNGAFSQVELEMVGYIQCSGRQISSLKGIEYFTALEMLYCSDNQLTALNVSKNDRLLMFSCSNNHLTKLDVSHNSALTALDCSGNPLTELDVSHNSALKSLHCGDTDLTVLDVSSNAALRQLLCSRTQLTELDVSSNAKLEFLECFGMGLTELDVSSNPALMSLNCSSNKLAKLDVSYNPALESLYCGSNQLTKLDVSNNIALKTLYCGNNQLKELDVSHNTALESLSCELNQLMQLDISHNRMLKNLYCDYNQLTELHLDSNTMLESISCVRNRLTELDMSSNPALINLYCYETPLQKLDVSKNAALKELYCNNTQLTSLDVSANTSLTSLYIQDCSYAITVGSDRTFTLSELPGAFDVTKASNWGGGTVADGVLTVNPGANLVTYDYDCGRNHTQSFQLHVTILDGIPIDAAHFPDANFRTFVAQYDTDGNGVLSEAELAAVTKIDCSEKDIASLKGIEYFTALTMLGCNGNQLKELDLRQNTQLTRLVCSQNDLTTLDVSNNTLLELLNCSDNQLTSLNLSQNTQLIILRCDNNQLITLDLSQNTKLRNLYCAKNKLKILDLSQISVFDDLNCSENELESLVLSQNAAVTHLYCNTNRLTALDVSGRQIVTLDCHDNHLTELNVSNTRELTNLCCSNNQLAALNVSSNAKLQILDCSQNQLTVLDVSQNAKLQSLTCTNNLLTSLNLSQTSIGTVNSHDNQYAIRVGINRTFDLSGLPGDFDVTRASSWEGGRTDGNTLIVDQDATAVAYTYDTGKGNVQFKLVIEELPHYTISYELDGGELPEGSTNPPLYDEVYGEIILVNPTKKGYTFAGWTGTDIAAATQTVTIPAGSTGNRSYTATWTADSYTISYDLAGGTLPEGATNPSGYTVESGEITLANPTKAGYTFAGWTGTDLEQATVDVTIQTGSVGNRSYTATWTADSYTISYDLAGGTLPEGATNPSGYTVESGAITLVNPTKAGYTFAGWTGTDIAVATQTVTVPAGSTGNRSYTATWTADGFTITCDLAGGTLPEGATNPSGYTVESGAITLVNPTKAGYTFAGWTGTDLEQATVDVTIPAGSVGNQSYTATWTADSYTITYDLAGGTLPEGATNPTGYTVESDAITLINPTRKGYTFAGWTGTDITAATQTVTILAGSTGNRSYTATWTADSYTITYDLAGGTLPEGATNLSGYTVESGAITLVNPTKAGYTFAGWTGKDLTEATQTVTIPAGSVGNRSYTASWTADSYTISYDLAGGILPEGMKNPTGYTVESTDITLVNPTKAGYTFAGWTGTDLTQATVDVTIPAGSTGNRLYTAKWSIVQYTIMYDLDGGELEQGVTNPTSYTIETEDFWLHEPIKSNYGFIGWTGSNGDEPQRSVGLQKGSTGSLSFKANFTPDIYRIDLDTDGGVTADGSELPTQYSIESDDVLLPLMVREGYEFLGWIGTGVEQPAKQVLILKGSVGDCSYKAKWQPIEYSIRYYLPDSAVHSGNPTSYTIESDDIVLNDARMTGYVFQGWLEDGKEQAAQKGLTIFKGSMGNRSFTAQFTEIEEKLPTIYVEYNNKGGSVTGAGSYDKHEQVRLEAKANEGWRFVCWRDSDNKIVHSEPVYTFLATKTLYLKAEFEKLPVSVNTRNEGLSEKHISEAMRRNGVETPEQIVRGMERVLAEAGIMVDGMANYDITLQISYDYGQSWTDVTQENMPKEGIWFELTFPKGSDPRRHEYYVTHMFASGPNAGQIEMPEFKVTDTGISVHLTSLSPVSVSWRLKPSQEDLRDLPETGDNSRAGLWFALMLLAGIGVLVLRRKTA